MYVAKTSTKLADVLRLAGNSNYDDVIFVLGYLGSGRDLPSHATCCQSSASEA